MANSVQQVLNSSVVKLNHRLYEAPSKVAAKERCKALAIKTLAIITITAILAISAAVLFISVGIGATSGLLPFIMVGLALATMPLSIASTSLWAKYKNRAEIASIEKGVAEELEQISGWKTPQVEQFFTEHGLDVNQLPMASLRVLNQAEPLCALLPLIARYNFCQKQSEKYRKISDEALIKQYVSPEVAYKARLEGWAFLEAVAIPRALEAALMLQIISQPALELKLSDLGRCDPKNFERRMFERIYDQADPFFLFNPPAHPPLAPREPITFAELVASLNPDVIRPKLFPIELRA